MVFSSVPSPVISMRTRSPGDSTTCGLRAKPTPAGVPVDLAMWGEVLRNPLILLLLLSAFFSLAETCMVASNRHRLRHAADGGNRGARLALDLLARMDRLLGVILLGNNLVNAAAATLVSVIAIELFGEEKWALGLGTTAVLNWYA